MQNSIHFHFTHLFILFLFLFFLFPVYIFLYREFGKRTYRTHTSNQMWVANKWYKINERKYALQDLIRFTFSAWAENKNYPDTASQHWLPVLTLLTLCSSAHAWNKILKLSGPQFIYKIICWVAGNDYTCGDLWSSVLFTLSLFLFEVISLFQKCLLEALEVSTYEKIF